MKKLSKKDRILLVVCGLIIVVITSYYGWFFWPWFGGKVSRVHERDWLCFQDERLPSEDLPIITNHSGYSRRETIRYFHDIALRMENQPLVRTIRKWNIPLCVFIIGTPDADDLVVLEEIFHFLNDIPGFPGIKRVFSLEAANVQLHFADEHMPKGATGLFNILSKDSDGNLTGVDVWIRNEMPRSKKTSVLWEELLQITGPMNDTSLTADTLFYAGTEDIPKASALDHCIIEMIYHPLIKSGMDYIQCLSIMWLYFQ